MGYLFSEFFLDPVSKVDGFYWHSCDLLRISKLWTRGKLKLKTSVFKDFFIRLNSLIAVLFDKVVNNNSNT